MAVYQLLSFVWRLIDAYELLIIVAAIMSWIPRSPGSLIGQVYDAITALTNPFLDLIRRILPSLETGGMSIDFSPIVGIIVLDIVKRLLMGF